MTTDNGDMRHQKDEIPIQKQGPGRPRVIDRPGFREDFDRILVDLQADRISKGEAARRLRISHSSLNRILSALEDES